MNDLVEQIKNDLNSVLILKNLCVKHSCFELAVELRQIEKELRKTVKISDEIKVKVFNNLEEFNKNQEENPLNVTNLQFDNNLEKVAIIYR